MSVTSRKQLLEAVEQCILGARQDVYGNPEDSFSIIADYWSTYLERVIRPHQVADMMELLKIARRQGQEFHLDNYIDGAGYAILAGELGAEEKVKLEDMKAHNSCIPTNGA